MLDVMELRERLRGRADTLEQLGRENRALTSEHNVAALVLTREMLREAADALDEAARMRERVERLEAVARMVAEASDLAGFSGPLGDAARAAIASATDARPPSFRSIP
jgi:hypothetical protein